MCKTTVFPIITPEYPGVPAGSIAVYNDLIAQLAEEKEVYLVDAHAALADENGVLPADESTDGVHLTKSGYQCWADYLRTHTVAPEEP